MVRSLVIVESPIKAKTIQKYLNDIPHMKYDVIASGGHIKDLPKKTLGITREHGIFKGEYHLLSTAKPFVKRVKELLLHAADVFICTDDDREGEAICEDIIETCKIKSYYRYAPREILKETIQNAIVQKVGIRQVDEKVIAAQRVRRQEDRIYGYMLSPIIRWYSNHSKQEDIVTFGTGRVEAIALDILYERHKLIEEYKINPTPPTDFIKASYKLDGVPFELKGEKLEFTKTENEDLEKAKKIARSNPHIIYSVTPHDEDYSPPPPFITSSLYSSASYAFGFEPEFTKKLAQELFYCGAINYPRTDSYMLSDDAVRDIVAYLRETVNIDDHDDILTTKRFYKNKKGAQAAHEAIRPTQIDIEHSPQNIMEVWKKERKSMKLGEQHRQLYELIWMNTVSTQYIDSSYDQKEVLVRCGSLVFKDKANMCIVKGWEKYHGIILSVSKKEDKEDWKSREKIIPENLRVGQILDNVTIDSYEKPSRAPKRVSMGALINMLESIQVARPSTMHSISQKIIKKRYATSHNTLLTLTKSGVFVAKFNSEFAYELVDRKKASKFEEEIQKIEKGEITNTNAVIEQCWDYIEVVKKRVNFIEVEKRNSTVKQVELAEKLYEDMSPEEQAHVNKEDFKNQEKVSTFIQKQKEAQKKEALNFSIGSCPKCKKNSVVETKETFKCLTDKCKFILYKKGLKKLFSSMGKDFSDDEITAIVSTILEDRVVFITGLNTKFGTKDSYFELSYNKKYSSYSFSFLRTDAVRDHSKGQWESRLEFLNQQQAKKVFSMKKEIEELNTKNKRLLDDSRKDGLTRANNRFAFETDLNKLIKAKDNPKINNQVFVALFDGDKFKSVNDTYGHGAGDEVLIAIVDTCFNVIREDSIPANVYRIGGDEFVVIIYGVHNNLAIDTLNKIKTRISMLRIGKNNIQITVSMGYTQYKNGDNSDSLYDQADAAQYTSKRKGGNLLSCYGE